jgi:hypothetical protein
MDTLKEKMVTTPILVFLDWGKDISCACICINDSTGSYYGVAKSRRVRLSNNICKQKIVRVKEKLQYYKREA